jgi:DNA-binding FadR family transcriptional regulator
MAVGNDGVVTTSVARQIAEVLRTAIVEGRLKTDERLPTEDELAQRYGVSRPTIREALKRLAAQNLVRSRRGPSGGNFVNRPKPEELGQAFSGAAVLMVSLGVVDHDEILDARLEMETVCCRMAAANRTPEHLQRLEEELALQKNRSVSDEEFCASDVRFHRTIVEATGNGPLRFVMFAVVEGMQPITNMVVFRVRERRAIIAYHDRLLQALRDQEPEMAVAALRELMAYLRGRITEAQSRIAEVQAAKSAGSR